MGSARRRCPDTEGGESAHLLDLILQLSDTVHMSEFLQHVAAFGDGSRGRAVKLVIASVADPHEQHATCMEHRQLPTAYSTPVATRSSLRSFLPSYILLAMGNDGGSIPDRRDLVKKKAKVESLTPLLQQGRLPNVAGRAA